MFDTADVHDPFANERLLGRALADDGSVNRRRLNRGSHKPRRLKSARR
jgi:hypothetical protein